MDAFMKALWLENQTVSFRTHVPVPDPGPGWARVRVRLAGICATDLELVRGYYPFSGIPGHEFVGDIVEAPDAPERIGQRVAGEINAACGHHRQCRDDKKQHCERRLVLGIKDLNGAFAEYLCLPLDNLIPVPESVPDEQAVFAEPLAACLEIQKQVHIKPDDRVLTLGAGRLGQLIAQTLALTGCSLVAAARHPRQRELLEKRRIPWMDASELPERAFDVVVEATGSRDGFAAACRAVRPRGTIVVKSTFAGNASIHLSFIVVNEITVIGSRCGPFRPALNLLESRMVDPAILIEETYPLNQALKAFERAARPGAMKILLTP
jgi:threonine dehydrogenase-like Zn-dependent dehydrogenase